MWGPSVFLLTEGLERKSTTLFSKYLTDKAVYLVYQTTFRYKKLLHVKIHGQMLITLIFSRVCMDLHIVKKA